MSDDPAYLRHPHLHDDLLCFVAEDDLWVAPLPAPGAETAPGRAWRLTVDRTIVEHPRFSPDGASIAFTTWRSLDPEIHLVPTEGGPARRLTHWGSADTRICGWTPPDEHGRSDILAVSSHGQPFSYHSWGHRLPTDGGPGGRLPWGPVAHIAMGRPETRPDGSDAADAGADPALRTLLLTGKPPHEPAEWKRYRGGAGGRLWYQGARLLEDIGGHLDAPMFVGDRIAFLSDHEGVGNLYSCRTDGSDLRRHTDHDAFYARHAASDGRRVVYQCAGDLWLVESLTPDAVPRRLPVRLGGPRTGRRVHQVPAGSNVTSLAVDTTGRASAIGVRGALYWLTHRDGPARVISADPGVRVRLPEMLGDSGRIAYVTDAEGEDAVEIAWLPRATGDRAPRRIGAGELGRVLELVSSPDGSRVAIASHDGRLLLVDTSEPDTLDEDTPEPSEDDGPAGAAAGSPAGNPDAADGKGADGDEGTADKPTDDAMHAGPGPDTPTPTPPAATPETGPDPTADPTATPATTLTEPPTGTGATATTGPVTELVRSPNGPVSDLAFSPDGGWLTWCHPGIGRSLSQIRMARITGPGPHTVVDVTNGRFADESPVFTRDGRYLAFLSWRGFDPVYDVHTGDLSFPLGCRPYLVPLNSATPSPFAYSPEGRPAGGGLDPVEGASDGEGAVTVEVEGLESRVAPFPVAASKYSALCPVAGGGLVWLRWPISGALGETFANPTDTSGKPTLEHFDLTKARRTELASEIDGFALSGDGTRLVLQEDGELRAAPSSESGDGDSVVTLDLRRILHEVDPAAEWRQAFDEAGRIVRAYFWEPRMCGIDWDGVLDQYRPLLDRVATPGEFADLLREVMGELGTSHAYVTAARRNEGPAHYQRPIGLLGANLVRRDDAWILGRILPGDSSDSKARSPLAGTGIREGSALTHVDGRPVDPVAGPAPLLGAAGGTTVELTFAPPEGTPGRPRRVAVVPLVDDMPLRYQDWVAKRREVVRELSGGRCGYLHIPDMSGSGWAQFHRDLRVEMSRPALIVDVRGNAGGHISELVVETLSRTILGWDLTRNAQPVSYASNAPRGPLVALADEATSSDGDMITAAFKLLGLGPVVGQRTWGGVVGMTGRHRLADGTVITVPMNAAWFPEYGWSVENHGVDPDLQALRTPLDWAEGRYAELDDAVVLALELLERNPPATPPGYTNVPDLRRPPLPPRA
ncbi:S41 family peptidase [Streptomyces sp. BI20]|uniref:S41 family peptidase n=1 Tax=Streptomyces sp. BI20 TaxID=3403460 RepID=UPI003C77FA29